LIVYFRRKRDDKYRACILTNAEYFMDACTPGHPTVSSISQHLLETILLSIFGEDVFKKSLATKIR
jgi:hypothetical protein